MPTATAQTAPATGLGRAGGHALSVFVRSLNAVVLRAHADGPLSFAELEQRLGWAAEASLRAATAELCELGAIGREGRQPIITRLTPGGRDLLRLAGSLERWLSHSPFGATYLDDPAARGTIKALAAGWDSTVIQALAERPRRLSDLSRGDPGYSYPALKRCFAKLRTAALAECLDETARSPEHHATPLLRRAAGVLGLAARWDLDHKRPAPLNERDLESILLLTLPLIPLPRLSGSCLLAVAKPPPTDGGPSSPSAVRLVIKEGRIADAAFAATSTSRTWALASPKAWLDFAVNGQLPDVRMGGPDVRLVKAVVSGIHRTLSFS